MNSEARFWDKIAPSYSKQPISDEASYQKKIQMTQVLLAPDFEVLEFGCGTGSTALYHAPLVNHIHAIDVSSRMLDIAKERASNAGIENISFEQSTLDSLNLANESKNMVLGLSVLHLLPNYKDSIQQVYQIIKPGGYFISNTPCLADQSRFLRMVAPLGKMLGLMPELSFFKQKELEETLIKTGFILDTCWQVNSGNTVFIIARKPE